MVSTVPLKLYLWTQDKTHKLYKINKCTYFSPSGSFLFIRTDKSWLPYCWGSTAGYMQPPFALLFWHNHPAESQITLSNISKVHNRQNIYWTFCHIILRTQCKSGKFTKNRDRHIHGKKTSSPILTSRGMYGWSELPHTVLPILPSKAWIGRTTVRMKKEFSIHVNLDIFSESAIKGAN